MIFWYNLNNEKRDKRFGAWNVRNMNRAGSLAAAAAREIWRYKLDVVGVQKLGGRKRTQLEQGIIMFSTQKDTKIINL